MIDDRDGASARPVLLSDVRPVGFGAGTPDGPVDILIGGDGTIARVGRDLPREPGAELIAGDGAFVSPGWCDLHVHVWHGGTDISIRPRQCGLERGVVTLVDAGSAGEANFAGFREFVIEPAAERIFAFLNIGSIGLVACNRVSELIDIRSIDVERTLACVEANRDVIRGIKVRASHVILGSWGITPVKVAKKVARIARLPLMVHVGEPPPMLDEILELLDPGDIVTHCFNGKPGGNILDDDHIYALAEKCAAGGVVLDVGHGAASYSFQVAEVAIKRGTAAADHLDRSAPALSRAPRLGPGDDHGEAVGRRHAIPGGGGGGNGASDGHRRPADRASCWRRAAAPSSPFSTWSRPTSASPTRWGPRPG